jgi:hypothetical protein
VRLESSFPDALNDVLDLLRCGAIRHVHDHGNGLSAFKAKSKSRDNYRGFGGIFELSSIILLVTGSDSAPPPQGKPIAAKWAEVGKSCHRCRY